MATIFVIDDCEPFRWLTRLALEDGGHRVIEAEGVKLYRGTRERLDLLPRPFRRAALMGLGEEVLGAPECVL